MPNFNVYIQSTMYDEQTADELSLDQGWLEAQWPECRRLATEAGKTVTGDPVYDHKEQRGSSPEGVLYDFWFRVPVA